MNVQDATEIRTRLDVIFQQIDRIREIVDDPEVPDEEKIEGDSCPHPEDKVIEVTTMGEARKWQCLACDEERNSPFPSSN